jgi:carboxypeptidase family protein
MWVFTPSSAADTLLSGKFMLKSVCSCFLGLIVGLLPIYVVAQAKRSTPSTPTEQEFTLAVEVRRPDGSPIRGVSARVGSNTAITDSRGRFTISLPEGDYKLQLSTPGYAPLTLAVSLRADTDLKITLQPGGAVTVRPEPDVVSPDPSTRIMAHEDVLDAHPVGLKRRNTSLLVLRETTVSQSHSTSKLGATCFQTTCPQMHTETGMPTRILLFPP